MKKTKQTFFRTTTNKKPVKVEKPVLTTYDLENALFEAERYFELASGIYEELLPIRFSNSLLPNFRKKQDVARSQVEQARSELVRAKMR